MDYQEPETAVRANEHYYADASPIQGSSKIAQIPDKFESVCLPNGIDCVSPLESVPEARFQVKSSK
jgi:hypothetical protein